MKTSKSLLFQFALHAVLKAHADPRNLICKGQGPWNFQKGALLKLQEYFVLYDPLLTHPLHQVIDKTIQRAVEGKEIDTSLHKILHHLVALIPSCYDENILWFVLKNQKEMNAIGGAGMIKKLFDHIFVGGKKEGGKWVSQAYAKRGFVHLEPLILQAAEEKG